MEQIDREEVIQLALDIELRAARTYKYRGSLEAMTEPERKELEQLLEFANKITQRDEALLRQALEALALLPDEIDMVEHNPDEGPLMFCCGRKVTLSWHYGLIPIHDEGCWYARMRALRALRDHYQENSND